MVKDNLTIIKKFPENFRFQLNSKEKDDLVTNCDHLKDLKFSRPQENQFLLQENQ